jgi:hypothetical protein
MDGAHTEAREAELVEDVPVKVGFWGIIKMAAKEVFQEFLTWGFWKRVIIRATKGMVAAAGEALWTAAGNLCIDVGRNVKKAMGMDENDTMFKPPPGSTPAGAAVFSRQPQPVRSYATEPNYRPATYPTQASDNGSFPGFPGR